MLHREVIVTYLTKEKDDMAPPRVYRPRIASARPAPLRPADVTMALVPNGEVVKRSGRLFPLHVHAVDPGPQGTAPAPLDEGPYLAVLPLRHYLHIPVRQVPDRAAQA